MTPNINIFGIGLTVVLAASACGGGPGNNPTNCTTEKVGGLWGLGGQKAGAITILNFDSQNQTYTGSAYTVAGSGGYNQQNVTGSYSASTLESNVSFLTFKPTSATCPVLPSAETFECAFSSDLLVFAPGSKNPVALGAPGAAGVGGNQYWSTNPQPPPRDGHARLLRRGRNLHAHVGTPRVWTMTSARREKK